MPETHIPLAPDPKTDPVAYLRSIHAVRERTSLVFEKAKLNHLNHFDVDWTKLGETADFVVSIIKRDYAPDYASIPPHGRWQHFDVDSTPRINNMIESWPKEVDATEKTRRLLDLFLVSVLLDAGAGSRWSYKEPISGKIYRRSEALGVASLDMFKSGLFSSDLKQPFQVDSGGLRKLTSEIISTAFQISPDNPMTGIAGRTTLLMRLADALGNEELFGKSNRPGNMLDYLINHPTTLKQDPVTIVLPTLWSVVMDGLSAIWPESRTTFEGKSLGDAWPLSSMPSYPADPGSWESIVPFHKLTQWLTYSLMVPMQKLLNIEVAGSFLLTGLPEYRNGGLLVDTGLLTLKPHDLQRGLASWTQNAKLNGLPSLEMVPVFTPDDDVVVEWRAVTVGFLDKLLIEVNLKLGLTGDAELNLAQMLEAGTWKGGREIAALSRPNTREPPIVIVSDGTVF